MMRVWSQTSGFQGTRIRGSQRTCRLSPFLQFPLSRRVRRETGASHYSVVEIWCPSIRDGKMGRMQGIRGYPANRGPWRLETW